MTIKRLMNRLLLQPGDVPASRADFEVVGVFNPGAARRPDGEVVLLVRVAERPRERRPGYTGLPRWDPDSGLTIDWVPDLELELLDPRVVRRKADGLVRLTFTSHLRVVLCGSGRAARDIMDKAHSLRREVVLPVDAVVAQKLAAHVPSRVVAVDDVVANDMVLDIGPRTIEHVISVLARIKTLVWNGPFGAFEYEPFDNGTIEIAEAAAELTAAGKLVSFAGGGDTVAALNLASVKHRMTHVSTGGGAFLESLEGKTLPGVEVLIVSETSPVAGE